MTLKSEHKVPMRQCSEIFTMDAQKCFYLETKQLPKFYCNTATPYYYSVKHSYCDSVATLPATWEFCCKAFNVYQQLFSSNMISLFNPSSVIKLVGIDEKILIMMMNGDQEENTTNQKQAPRKYALRMFYYMCRLL